MRGTDTHELAQCFFIYLVFRSKCFMDNLNTNNEEREESSSSHSLLTSTDDTLTQRLIKRVGYGFKVSRLIINKSIHSKMMLFIYIYCIIYFININNSLTVQILKQNENIQNLTISLARLVHQVKNLSYVLCVHELGHEYCR